MAIDGKTSRCSHDRAKGRGPLHLVSAWASRPRLAFGQQATAEESNETSCIPLRLERLGSDQWQDRQPQSPPKARRM